MPQFQLAAGAPGVFNPAPEQNYCEVAVVFGSPGYQQGATVQIANPAGFVIMTSLIPWGPEAVRLALPPHALNYTITNLGVAEVSVVY